MLKRELIEKWCQENEGFCDNSKELDLRLHKWLEVASNEEQQILLSLFEFSHFFSKKKVFAHFVELYKKLCDKEYTLFSAIESQDYRNNSSHGYLSELHLALKLSDYNIIHSISCFPIGDMKYIRNIVFVDDIIGTGKTVTDFFDEILDYLFGKRIYLWVVCITEDAYEKIKKYANENKLVIKVQEKRIEKKAFKRGYIFDGEDSDKKEKMILAYETRMWKKDNLNILGRYNSQCLVSFYNDTPNNTLSSFWYDKAPYKAIFYRRKKEKPKWKQMSERNKDRRMENYKRKKESYD